MKLVITATLLAFSAALVLILGIRFTTFTDHQIQTLGPILIVVAIIAFLCFMVGEITRNYSQVDKLWSLLPIGYGWYFAISSGWASRPTLMAVLTTLWGVRLTYNFIRRGGYSLMPWKGEEDYRWEVIRNNPFFKGKRFRLTLFNLLFICAYQNLLIFLFSTPPLFAGDSPLNYLDGILAIVYIILLVMETISDQQQYSFQNKKHDALAVGGKIPEVYRRGFIQEGLWKYSRHPNYACEQGVWLTLYLISVIPTGDWVNPSAIGIILLMVLFYSSSQFSEGISSQKYPHYREYIKVTPRFFPNLFDLLLGKKN